MRQASWLLSWLALACLIGAACAAAGPAIIDDSSSHSRELLQTGSTQNSKPACVCPMHYEPVCGSDGKTYGNGCSAKCRGIKVSHRGECKPYGTVKGDTMASEPSSSSSKKKPNCSCAKIYAPVCCKGGHTYGNACEAKCVGAEIESTGECPHKDAAGSITSTTNTPSPSSESATSAPTTSSSSKKANCVCAKMYAPVCCKGDHTYSNACEAKCAGAEIIGQGECPHQAAAGSITSTTNTTTKIIAESAACSCDDSVKEVCGDDGKTYSNQCMATCAGAKVASEGACKAAAAAIKAKCHAPCWWPYKPVCGSDGKTYGNECRAACRGVEVVSQGACRVKTRNGWFGRKPSCVCTANYDPVCGKNGKTYSNSCEADCEGIAVDSKGACEEPVEANTSGGNSTDSSKKSSSPGSCVCPMVWKPVCTKNGKTRGNKCEARCRGETVAREGECDIKVDQIDKAVAAEENNKQGEKLQQRVSSLSAEEARLPSSNVPMKPPRKLNCVCIQLWAPVCGTDGNTYSNSCEARCHGMTVAREGECDKTSAIDGAAIGAPTGSHADCRVCPALFAPVCGKDGKTYGNDCEAKCRGKTAVAHQGACKGDKQIEHTGNSGLDRCLESCPVKANKPVCGVDRKRYKSACAARCHKVDIAYPGDCKGECSACPHTWFPYCANSAQYGPSTFANCCFAKCNNVPIIKSVLHAGVCLDKCGKCDPTLERPLCCKGRTYKNGCYASCNEEDTSQCSAGRCSSTAHVELGVACLLGPCPLQCAGDKYDKPVCGSDGNTYPSQCSLMCSQHVAIVHEGKCGTCAPNQLPGGFPFCSHSDRTGVQPVCGKDGVTYRNSIAASEAKVDVASQGTCTARQCSEENEVCFVTGSEQSSCCPGYTCTPDSSVTALDDSLAMKVMGGVPGFCRKATAVTAASLSA